MSNKVPSLAENVYLYILMRTDLASMNPGKACAQATHAANQCVYDVRHTDDLWLHSLLVAWEGDRGFGTCIVLGVTGTQMAELVQRMTSHGIHAKTAHDPSYPLRDGDVTHLIPLDTCAYAFGPKDLLMPFLERIPLMS
jgi:peptidyl-tRNA hydrolase